MSATDRDEDAEPSNAAEHSRGWWHIIKETIAGLHRNSWVQNFAVAIPFVLISIGGAVFVTNKQLAVVVITVGLTIVLWGAATAIFVKIGELDNATHKPKSQPTSKSQNGVSPTPATKQQTSVVPTSTGSVFLQTSPLLMQPTSQSPSEIINQAASGYVLGDVSQFGGPSAIDYTGSYVDWILYLVYVRDNYAGGLEVTCTDMPGSTIRIIFTVDSFGNEYLQRVQIDREKQLFNVSGSIDRVGSAEIWLHNSTIQPAPSIGL